jgi:hypothetical protein
VAEEPRWAIAFTRRAKRDFDALEPAMAARVTIAIRQYAATERGDVRGLQGRAAGE